MHIVNNQLDVCQSEKDGDLESKRKALEQVNNHTQ